MNVGALSIFQTSVVNDLYGCEEEQRDEERGSIAIRDVTQVISDLSVSVSSPLEQLPPELICHIITYLPSKEAVGLQVVSRIFSCHCAIKDVLDKNADNMACIAIGEVFKKRITS